ncbi:MAG: Cro/CI family transcriptional regulator [Caldilinea sp.]|nr:Cro/CI family transcriptional regulator [Caldilinea sp.]MDW8440942.1 Cro/CI family transcriptional regulator [Caldilineaceae bacterium]
MTVDELLTFYGSGRRAAYALGIDPSTVSRWIVAGRIPPKRQIEIEKITGGLLKADCPKREATDGNTGTPAPV